MSPDIPARKTHRVYRIGQIVFVPHYTRPYLYVGPGYPKYDDREWYPGELERRGAIEDHMELWERRM